MQAQQIDFLALLNGQYQYVVPRWQRRYRWGQADIERLVDDLVTIAGAGPDAAHYGGTLLTFREPGAAGVVNTIRVVDGQQRLTTVSILLACIAAELGPDGRCGDWTAQIIRDDRLTNPGKPPAKLRKLRLQDGDEEEYRRGLEGRPAGPGTVSQAWSIARRLVAKHGAARLLAGLERLRVVSIGLDERDDPQQIFESLNATGRPLTESEKIKNWLLMGLRDAEQQRLHDDCWRAIERVLAAEHDTEPIDTFLRDFLRWKTGDLQGIDRVYDGFRRWAVPDGRSDDRPALCRDLARLAQLYGIVTGSAGAHRDAGVERELRHLREMGIDIHRPLTLRLLDDAAEHGPATDEDLAKVLTGIGTWTTRLWLADRATAGMNRALTDLAHGSGPGEGEDFAEYWLGRIRRFRGRVGVPSDDEVRAGIRRRKAYGGSATRSSFAVLCALMEAEHREESPARDRLTIEHVMPQKLTDEWKRALGDEPEQKHEQYRDQLANLTLSGDATNSRLAARTFAEKREMYRSSPIGMTRRLADEDEWDEDALERRADEITRLVLSRWPWSEQAVAPQLDSALKWRVDDGPWQIESAASQMVLNVAGALLSRDSANAERLSGDAISSNVHSAQRYPPGTAEGTLVMRAVPGHDRYVMYPYGNSAKIAERCRKMGERCGVTVEVELDETSLTQRFWGLLKNLGGVFGQVDGWQGPGQWTSPVNSSGDRIGIYVGHDDLIWLYVHVPISNERAARARHYSRMIREQMGDQEIGDDLEKKSQDGRTVNVQRSWTRDDEDGWPEAAQWIIEQHDRLRAIVEREEEPLIDEPVDPPGAIRTLEPLPTRRPIPGVAVLLADRRRR